MLTEKQKEARRTGIGASESAIIMGVNPYCSPYELWLEKTGRKAPDDLSTNQMVHWGTISEEIIANEYARIIGNKVRRVSTTLRHKKYPYLLCHLDRKITGHKKILECKFASAFAREWGEHGSDEIPLHYIVQVQHQLAVTGYEEADLAVLIGGCDFRIYPIKRDEEVIERIISDVSNFWIENVIRDIQPDIRDRNDAALCYPSSNGSFIQADDDILKCLSLYKEIRSDSKLLEAKKEKLSDQLTVFIKDAEGIVFDDKVVATWKPRKDGVRVLKIMENK